jgi:DNA-damage-inducible protein J
MTTSMVHIRLDEGLKVQATETLDSMGLSISEAVRVFLTQVISEKRIPFELKVPNKKTKAAMEEADLIHEPRFNTAEELFNALEKRS